jgi:hypothetical protein
MRMVRDLTSLDRVPYLTRLGLEPDDVGRLAVVEGEIERTGLYVNGETGESRFLREGDAVPDGIWVANREIEDVRPEGFEPGSASHGVGDGSGAQAEQLGGDRSVAEEDAGGTRRVPHTGVTEDVDPFVGDASG